MMTSPFPYDRLPKDDLFFGRAKEIEELAKYTHHGNNVLLFSKRRMGKTSLIQHFLHQQSDHLGIYVDIFDISTKEDFAISLLKALSSVKKSDLKSTVKWLTSLFKRVRVEPTLDPQTLEYSIKPVVVTLSFEQMMEEWFHSIEMLSQSQPLIIAIDEFQQIAEISDVKLDALLRQHLQQRSNVSYIFSGSKRHLLTSLFEYQAPLFEMATPLALQSLSAQEFHAYASKHLSISSELMAAIHEKSDGETKMIQNILHLLWLERKREPDKEMVESAITEIINSRDSSYRLIYDSLSANQKTALKIVGQLKRGFFAASVLEEWRIKKQTLQSAVDSLYKRELIDKEGNDYFIPDRSFEMWVERL